MAKVALSDRQPKVQGATTPGEVDARTPSVAVHLLDVGQQQYGDAVLCIFGGKISVLIDGAHPGNYTDDGRAHPSLQSQIADLLGQPEDKCKVDLLIVTHGHSDHIGCLPALVEAEILGARWALVADPGLAWGRKGGHVPDASTLTTDQILVAALREEPLSPLTDDSTVQEFLTDAASLETKYNAMLDQLGKAGTSVVRLGRDNPADLVSAFASIGLVIHGPSQDILLKLAEMISDRGRDFDALSQLDKTDLVVAYKQLMLTRIDAQDKAGSIGALVNCQSIVTSFQYEGVRLLFSGDMQFQDPEIGDSDVTAALFALRKQVARGKYDFVKLGHHGSYNAFSEEMLGELSSTKWYGICAGSGSRSHPNPETLSVLKEHTSEITWLRTDRNGQSSYLFPKGNDSVQITRGKANDARPNSVDVLPESMIRPAAVPEGAKLTQAVAEGPKEAAPAPGVVQVVARLPFGGTVNLSISSGEAERLGIEAGAARGAIGRGAPSRDGVQLAGGRQLPRLLFVTSSDRLKANIGSEEGEGVFSLLRSQHCEVLDIPGGVDVSAAASLVRARVVNGVAGIVLLGGYDVVPSERRDCIPQGLASKVRRDEDPDSFVVWSDDVYGDTDGDGWPELPVSRIPDGKSADLVYSALAAAPKPSSVRRSGVRNVKRPFADGIYADLPGTEKMQQSKPIVSESNPDLSGQHLYLMLHGSSTDGTRFWGEETVQNRPAIHLTNLELASPHVVFAGCCWGALPVDKLASDAKPGAPLGSRTPGQSIALRFLLSGTTGFVGCTGAHYSPTEAPFAYFGGPIHEAFWSEYAKSNSPATALLEAKRLYRKGMPHGQTSAASQAVEYKILNQFTCLGLGW